MAIPSLAMIPSGYKDGKVYSVLPSDGRWRLYVLLEALMQQE